MKTGGSDSRGFTVVETLIVLGVTSLLFLMVALTVSGRQAKTEFQVGSRHIQQSIQQIINEAATGYTPSVGDFDNDFTCTENASGLQITAASSEQGANDKCIFIGKTIILGGAKDTYSVYSIAGRRTMPNTSGDRVDVKTPRDTLAAAIPSSLVTRRLPNGLTYKWARVKPSGAQITTEFPVAVFSGLANFQGATHTTESGMQTMELRGYEHWNGALSDTAAINEEAKLSYTTQYPLYGSGIEVCFEGSGNQSVLITISEGLEVARSVRTGANCP